jgi:hypothetical protein
MIMTHWYIQKDTQRCFILMMMMESYSIIVIHMLSCLTPPSSVYYCRVGAQPSYPTLTALTSYTYDPQVAMHPCMHASMPIYVYGPTR